jgi:hypothetical protein
MTPLADQNHFYEILEKLKKSPRQGLSLDHPGGASRFAARGVYFFCEADEQRSSCFSSSRIVRVGTHAISAKSKSTLWQRLRAHLGTRLGQGNHRGSIFRLHVGAALLARDQVNIPTWGIGSSAPQALREDQAAQSMESLYEQKVSKYISSMKVLWINVPDEPGPKSLRAAIEQNAIALLSNRFSPVEPASANWLGLQSPRDDIRRSGLWNINYVNQDYDPRFLELLDAAVERTLLRE